MTMITNFPDFDNAEAFTKALGILEPLGFIDGSYSNDACPSIVKMNDTDTAPVITLYVDYANPLSREMPEQSEFAIITHGFFRPNKTFQVDMWTSAESLSEALDFITSQLATLHTPE